MTPPHRHHTAADLAAAYIEGIKDIEALTARDPFGAAQISSEVYQALHDGTHDPGLRMPPPPTNNALLRHAVYSGAADAATRRLWQTHRIVYDIDPDLWAALGDTTDDTVIPMEVFTRLPHPNPFIALPEPLELPTDDDLTQRVEGFFVVGRTTADHWQQVSTHSPAAAGLGLLIGGRLYHPDGRPSLTPNGTQDMIWARMSLRAGHHAEPTVGELINAVSERFFNDVEAMDDVTITLPARVRRCVSVLVYLCATNADLRPLPAPLARRQGKTRGRAKPVRTVQVGYRVGAALRAHRRAAESGRGAGAGAKRAPHVRRAHFHLYWTGVGRKEPRMKWLAPIPINMGGEAESTTVVPVGVVTH